MFHHCAGCFDNIAGGPGGPLSSVEGIEGERRLVASHAFTGGIVSQQLATGPICDRADLRSPPACDLQLLAAALHYGTLFHN
jgi:hypothetical protein